MRREKQHTKIHRFRDYVSITLGRGETVYLTAREARQLSRAINKAVKSCETESFLDSTFESIELEFGGKA